MIITDKRLYLVRGRSQLRGGRNLGQKKTARSEDLTV